MKRTHSIYLLALLLTILSVSCQKGIDTVDYDSVVYLPQSGNTTQTALIGESVFKLGVYRSGLNTDNKNLTVTLGIDEAAGASFIAQNAGYEMLPSTYYSIPSTTVSIGKNEQRAYYQVNMKGIDASFTGKKYILPVAIKSVDNDIAISQAQNTAILQFTRFRNVYEAEYKAYGSVTPSGTTTSTTKIDEVLTSTSVDANTIRVKGVVSGMNLLLKVQDGKVQITGATGSEAFNIANTTGKTSTYTGSFSDIYQCNTGTYTLYYTYTYGGQTMEASVELKFWL